MHILLSLLCRLLEDIWIWCSEIWRSNSMMLYRCVVGDHITIRLSPLHVWAQYMYTLGVHVIIMHFNNNYAMP